MTAPANLTDALEEAAIWVEYARDMAHIENDPLAFALALICVELRRMHQVRPPEPGSMNPIGE